MATVAMGLGQLQRFLSCDLGMRLHTCDLGMGCHSSCLICPLELKARIGHLRLFLQTRNERHREAFVPEGPACFTV